MPREKFVYNKHTLRFERLQLTLKERVLKLFSFVSAVLVASVIALSLAFTYFPSPREKMLLTQIKNMDSKYAALNNEINTMSKVLENIQDRDANVHRLMFGMDPIDPNLWEGGIGGRPKKFNFGLGNAGESLLETEQRTHKLERQLVMQSMSLDTIMNLAKSKERMYSAIPIITPLGVDKFKGRISSLSGFGMRIHPILKVRRMHTGLDFPAPVGTAIQATGDGRVEKIEYSGGGYGKNVIINHGYGYKTLYAHMSNVSVKEGQSVKRGQKIGSVGSTGRSSAPHCHYEVIVRGQKVNPVHYCIEGVTPAEYKDLVEMSQNSNISYD